MSINEYREKIEEIKKVLQFGFESLDESLCRIDGVIDNINGREMIFSRLDILCALDRVRTAKDLLSEVLTSEVDCQ